MNDPKNWASWAALLIVFGGVGLVGTGANGVRLWFKKRNIGRSPGERLTVILADLVGDDSSRGQKQNVRDSLELYLGSSIHIIAYPQALAIAEGHFDAELTKTHAMAQRILENKRGDLLIWGRVKSANLLALYFTGRSVGTSEVSPYMLVSDAERALELPLNFDRDLGAAVAARVVAVGNALLGKVGSFLTPYAERFAEQIAPLVAHPKSKWTPDARGAVLHAFGLAKNLAGREQADRTSLEEAVATYRALEERTRARAARLGDDAEQSRHRAFDTGGAESGTARLEEAVAAYRAALEERTRARAPLQWAATQNNLGTALSTLGERESGTARLEEAVAAFRAALEERTRARVPLQWAMTQNNLGTALSTLGERESGTVRLEEAVAAYRAALEEWTRAAAPHWHGIAQRNLAGCVVLLEQRRNP
jgi:tetratricopeptide (TPR) repeat protein